tara:strand:- start:2566 stop:3363 length:798 start_codon:yes stop_codon:yes gene_type:complete
MSDYSTSDDGTEHPERFIMCLKYNGDVVWCGQTLHKDAMIREHMSKYNRWVKQRSSAPYPQSPPYAYFHELKNIIGTNQRWKKRERGGTTFKKRFANLEFVQLEWWDTSETHARKLVWEQQSKYEATLWKNPNAKPKKPRPTPEPEKMADRRVVAWCWKEDEIIWIGHTTLSNPVLAKRQMTEYNQWIRGTGKKTKPYFHKLRKIIGDDVWKGPFDKFEGPFQLLELVNLTADRILYQSEANRLTTEFKNKYRRTIWGQETSTDC